ncbi:MAG TPA: DUF3429 domain-containing protein [Usitatibacter sp.]|jgi:hypothetical protein|nr:DUF3429 domain-containing protein [Usitatibacter sp.]
MVQRIVWIFSIAGAVVLAAITAMLFSGQSHIRVPAIAALVTFAAVILSYLGGIEWGLALQESAGTERTRAIGLGLSTIPALAAWGILWAPSPTWQVGGALVLFVAVWCADLWLARQGLIPSWFVDMRTAVTAAVCVILGVALYLI